MIDRKNHQAIRIIQHPENEGMTAWGDNFGGEKLEPEAIKELVITCGVEDHCFHNAMTVIGVVLNWKGADATP